MSEHVETETAANPLCDDERPLLVVNENEWSPKLIAEAERMGYDVRPQKHVPRRTAYVIPPNTFIYKGEFSFEEMMSAHPTSVADA